MNEPQKHLVNIVKACIRAMYEWRNIPHHVIYMDMLSRADSALDDLDESGPLIKKATEVTRDDTVGLDELSEPNHVSR